MKRALLKLLAGIVGLTGAVWAQENDGPGRGVARISVINGDVSVRRGDSGDWVAAAINAPLVVDDRITTGSGSRAEVQFDWANMIRLAPLSEVRFSELEYRRYQLQVARGLVTFRVLRDIDAQVEISTPSVSVRPVKKGVYRIEVRDDGTTEVTVRKGEAEIFTPRGSERLSGGRTMIARGPASDPEFQIVRATGDDDWDHWNERRDRDLERARSYQYVSSDIYGAEDLDAYGVWVNVASYGWVWRPRVVVGWAPYRYGRWVWVDWYGWTWVSYDPWGWAPYHYGRWFYAPTYGWCWWPGAYGPHHHHYWSPALVAFFGWGGRGGGIGFGFGHVGWVPLGPHEPYHRWYGHDYYRGYRGGYVDNSVHIVNNVNIINNYRNARVHNAMTGIDAEGFVRGRRDGMISVGEREARAASLVRGVVPVAPTRESLRLADRDAHTNPLPRSNSNERFFSRSAPARIERVPFEEQRRGVERIAARMAGGDAGLGGGRLEHASGAPAPVDNSNRGGWRRADTVERSTGVTRQASPADVGRSMVRPGAAGNQIERQGGERTGWRRFGDPARNVESESRARIERHSERNVIPSQVRSPEPGASIVNRRESSENHWRRFGGGAGNPAVGPTPRSTPPESAPRENFSVPRTDTSRWGAPRTERLSEGPVRISPPIVRERSMGYERPGGVGPLYRAPEVRSGQGAPHGAGGGGREFATPPAGGGAVRGGGGGGRAAGGGGHGGRGR